VRFFLLGSKFINRAMKFYIYIALLLLIFTIERSYSQSNGTDNNTALSVSTRMREADSLYNAGKKYHDVGNFKEASPFFEKSLTIYSKSTEYKRIGECLSNIGVASYYKGDFSEALKLFEKSVIAFEKVGYHKGTSTVLNNIGGIYFYLGNDSKALESYKRAVDIQGKIGDKSVIGALLNNIGSIYTKMKDYSNAMSYHGKALAVYDELKDEKAIAQSLIRMGSVHVKTENYDERYENFKKALVAANRIKDKNLEMEVLSQLGELFYTKSKYQEALSYYAECLKNATELENVQFISESQIEIGNIFHKLNRNTEALIKCKAGLKIAEDMKAISVQKDACECLYNAYKALKNTSLALSYYEKANALDDSLKSEETSNKLMAMEVEKQQAVDSVAYVQKATIIQQKHKEDIRQREKQRNIIIVSLVLALLVAAGALGVLNFVRKSRAALRVEKDRSEALLLNILPEEIAEELKEKGSVGTKNYELVSILFSDFIGFTKISEQMSPESLVEEINECFKAFDLIAEKHQVEKIKTIGDAYMAAGGMPIPDENSYRNVVLAGLDMQQFMLQRASHRTQLQLPYFDMRLGIHVGPIVAGIVGIKKFQYDVWGDTVNTASRIESNGMVGKVNISESLYDLIKDESCFAFEHRGSVNAKGKGDINMYFVEKAASV
jgi:class 3 adenylate cyclase/predicted metal-dependent hydrolase